MEINREAEPFFAALASATRLRMVELLCARGYNIGELAREMGLSAAITTRHIQTLERAGIVACEHVPGGHGVQKRCAIAMRGVTLTMPERQAEHARMVFDIPLGQYASWNVAPTCGLASLEGMIGCVDDPRYFADPARADARCLWVGHGYVEYLLPNHIHRGQAMRELAVQMEICAEAPGYAADWPSDIYFSVAGCALGFWTSPGDFGERPGALSPAWYRDRENVSQFGQLKELTVNERGTFIDGVRIGAVTAGMLPITPGAPIALRIESPAGAANPRGFTLFGKGFGNYDCNITVTMTVENMKE